MKKIWTCPKCGRRFRRENQIHSCTVYPVEKHFERKDYAKTLYDALRTMINEAVGNFYVESLPCCIHFVTDAYTFAAVYALRKKIRIHIALNKKTNSKYIDKSSQMYAKGRNVN